MARRRENLERLIHLAEEFFDVRHDPEQISVGRPTMARLRKVHPSTMTERSTKNGPYAWMLIVPTTSSVMERFISGGLNERDLLRKTPIHTRYDAIYLCSALVLPEHRRKGLAARLLSNAVKSVMKDHPIRTLFYWEFSRAGRNLARAVARKTGLPLKRRKN